MTYYRNTMKDSEILATIHRWMKQSMEREESTAVMGNRLVDCAEYIEEQWRLEDEHTDWQNELFAKNDDGQQYSTTNTSSHSAPDRSPLDVSEIEKHRGLEIGPDGTVTSIL